METSTGCILFLTAILCLYISSTDAIMCYQCAATTDAKGKASCVNKPYLLTEQKKLLDEGEPLKNLPRLKNCSHYRDARGEFIYQFCKIEKITAHVMQGIYNMRQTVWNLSNNRVFDAVVGQVLHFSDMSEDPFSYDVGHLFSRTFPSISYARSLRTTAAFIRDCSDASSFGLNITRVRIFARADNQTVCGYSQLHVANVCVSVCDTDYCNGPIAAASYIVGSMSFLIASILAGRLLFT